MICCRHRLLRRRREAIPSLLPIRPKLLMRLPDRQAQVAHRVELDLISLHLALVPGRPRNYRLPLLHPLHRLALRPARHLQKMATRANARWYLQARQEQARAWVLAQRMAALQLEAGVNLPPQVTPVAEVEEVANQEDAAHANCSPSC